MAVEGDQSQRSGVAHQDGPSPDWLQTARMRYRAKQPQEFWHATVVIVAGIHTVEATSGHLLSPCCRIPALGEVTDFGERSALDAWCITGFGKRASVRARY